jgi:hypothetical protein
VTDVPAAAAAAVPPPPPIDIPPEAVIRELCSSDLGRALWERAEWRIAADVLQRQNVAQQARIDELEQQKSPAATPPSAPNGKERAGG